MWSEPESRDELKGLGWRQGSILPRGIVEVEEQEVAIVVSQDCDLLNEDLAKEPVFEILVAKRIKRLDGNFIKGRNPRRINVSASRAGETWLLDAHASSRSFQSREVLLGNRPDGDVAADDLDYLKRWLGRRYYRAAFPDNFNERIRPANDKIEARLLNLSKPLTSVFLAVSDAELPPGRDYEITIYGAMLDDDYQDQALRDAALQEMTALATAVGGCTGISVLDFDVRGEADISLNDLRTLSRWDYDSLSLKAPGAPLVPVDAD